MGYHCYLKPMFPTSLKQKNVPNICFGGPVVRSSEVMQSCSRDRAYKYNFINLLYKVVRFICMKLKISEIAGPNWFYFLGKPINVLVWL